MSKLPIRPKRQRKATGTAGRIFAGILNTLLTLFLILFITGIIVGCTFAVYVNKYLDPEIDESLLNVGQSLTSKVYYYDYEDREYRVGEAVEIEDQRLYGAQNNIWVSYTDMPEDLVDAFVSLEDHRFFEHSGVDWYRTAGAVLNFVTSYTGRYGGSTITQQLIKNVTGEDDVTIQRKVEEILRALNLEKKKEKSEIIEMYLNTIFLSQNCNGVQAAAYTYFGKDVSELSLIECAALASITNAPTKYDPVLNPENNKERRDICLSLMLKYEKITQEEFDAAYDKELELNYKGRAVTTSNTSNSWYTDAVIDDVIDALVKEYGFTSDYASDLVWTGGLQIYTLMDPEVQNALEEVYENEASFPKANNAIQPQSAMVVIDPKTGDVLGLVGARGEKSANRLLNHATHTTRSPGSSIKPLSVYGPALEYGLITYGSVFDDVPVTFNSKEYTDKELEELPKDEQGETIFPDPTPYPKNLPYVYNGLTTVHDALRRSVNTISVRILDRLGIDNSFDFVTNKLHMDSFIEYKDVNGRILSDKTVSSLAMGGMTYGVTVLEMTAAYQIFANNGVYNKPRMWDKVIDSQGNVILENKPESEVVISEQNASIMTKMMQDVVTSGTAADITLKNKVNTAGKTGTTNDDYDRWFMGYTPYYVAGIWFGYDIPMSLDNLPFSPTTKPWDTVMTKLHEDIIAEAQNGGAPIEKFTLAAGIQTAEYCRDSGKLISEACLSDPRGSRKETGYFTDSTVPTEYCDTHILVDYDEVTGGVVVGNCPDENVVKVGMIQVDRSFPIDVTVTDAQYVYKTLPSGLEPGLWWGVPFFENIIPEDTFVGLTNLKGGRQFNSACYEHYTDVPAEDEKDTDETEDTDVTDDTSDVIVPDPDNEKFEDETGETEDSSADTAESESSDTEAEDTEEVTNEEQTTADTEEETAPPWLGL